MQELTKKNNRNPFRPGHIMIDPTKYAGREDLIIDAFEYLLDQRSLFITGQRGVGKSSFSMQLCNLLKDQKETYERFDIDLYLSNEKTIVVNYRCTGDETFSDFVKDLLIGLSNKVNRTIINTEKVTKKWKFDLKFFSHENNSEEKFPSKSLIKEFSDILIDCYHNVPYLRKSGICFMIDEIDLIINKIDLGIFIKVVLENLSDEQIQNVKFILVGISNGLRILKQQHPSITRFLIPIYVPPMNEKEMDELISRALADTDISFNPEICQAIYILSQGFPDPVHLFGSEIYKKAKKNDSIVNFQIFEEVLHKISTVIKKEENLSIRNKIPNLKCEKFLLEMARINEESITIDIISKRIEISSDECNNLCKELVNYNFLEQHGVGVFKFTDPLFRVYLNMANIEKEARIERTNIFFEINRISNELHQPSEEERKRNEKFIFEIIMRNYKETGKSGFWNI